MSEKTTVSATRIGIRSCILTLPFLFGHPLLLITAPVPILYMALVRRQNKTIVCPAWQSDANVSVPHGVRVAHAELPSSGSAQYIDLVRSKLIEAGVRIEDGDREERETLMRAKP
jgi:hypothetical protein